jgi:hypothetical protein
MSENNPSCAGGANSRAGRVRAIRFEDEDLRRMKALAARWRCSEAAAVRRAVAIAAEQELSGGIHVPEAPGSSRPIWQRLMERADRVPEEEIADLPTDLAQQHDHYAYGTPKR